MRAVYYEEGVHNSVFEMPPEPAEGEGESSTYFGEEPRLVPFSNTLPSLFLCPFPFMTEKTPPRRGARGSARAFYYWEGVHNSVFRAWTLLSSVPRAVGSGRGSPTGSVEKAEIKHEKGMECQLMAGRKEGRIQIKIKGGRMKRAVRSVGGSRSERVKAR